RMMSPFLKPTSTVLSLFFMLILIAGCHTAADPYHNWEVVNGNGSGNKYSSLHHIDTSNVQKLQVAWTYHTGDKDSAAHSQIQCNPVIINGVMYVTSPRLKLIALNAATGKPI